MSPRAGRGTPAEGSAGAIGRRGEWFGLGPASRAMLARAGVTTPAELRRSDAVQLYAQVKALDGGASLNLLYAIVGAQEGRPWQEIARERRTELLLRLDDLGHAPR